MTGNMDENVISIHSAVAPFNQGVNFTRKLGDGEISFTPTPGYANQGWTEETRACANVNSISGIMRKGGGCNTPAANCQVSARITAYNFNRYAYYSGGRGVR